MEPMVPLCNSADLVNGGRAVPFDIVYAGQNCRAFAIRYQDQVHAYLNRCTHVAMEMTTSPTGFMTTRDGGSCVPRTAPRTNPIPALALAAPAGVDWSK